MGRRLKYMGSADVRIIEEGESWGGRLGTPLESQVVFNRENNRTVDASEVGLTDAAVKLLLEDPMFLDVTDQEIVPAGLNEQMFYGVPGTPDFRPVTSEREELTVNELQERLEALGLSKSGKKDELVKRLAAAEAGEPPTT